MTDEEEEAYTNLDLETAEAMVIAAGHPKLAPALMAHAQGVRNLVQGEWGKSFVTSLEDISARQTETIVAAVGGQIAALQREVSAIRGQFQDVSKRMDASEEDRRSIHREIAAFRQEFQQYITGSRRDEFSRRIAELEQRIQHLEARGDGD